MPLARYKRTQKREPFHFSQITTPELIYPLYKAASLQAEAFHASPKQIRALFGGDRSGKSGTCAYEIISLMRKFPGCEFWTAALTEDLIPPVWSWHKKFLNPAEFKSDVVWRNRGKDIPAEYHHINGSVMKFKTFKSGAGVFSAASVKAIHLDEDGARVTPQMEQIYSDCLSRILDQDGYLMLSATPVLGKNWMHRRIYMKNRDNRPDHTPDPDIAHWTVSLDDNRYITAEQKEKQLGRLTKDELSRRYYGRFVTLSGMCFKKFNPDVHNLTVEPVIPASWRRIRVIDFGYNHPFYCGWYAQSPDGVIYQYDEHHQNHTLLKEHARIIFSVTEAHKFETLQGWNMRSEPIEVTVADHDAQERAELENPDLGAHAIYTVPALKDVKIGIQTVNRYLAIDPRGQTQIYISPRCPIAQIQLENYHYKLVREGNEEKEVVDKIDDEAPDCLRYGVMYFDQGRRRYDVEQ